MAEFKLHAGKRPRKCRICNEYVDVGATTAMLSFPWRGSLVEIHFHLDCLANSVDELDLPGQRSRGGRRGK